MRPQIVSTRLEDYVNICIGTHGHRCRSAWLLPLGFWDYYARRTLELHFAAVTILLLAFSL